MSNPGQTLVLDPTMEPEEDEEVWLAATTFFDRYGRAIQTRAENHLGGSDVAWTQYDFAGRALKAKRRHTTDDPAAEVVVRERFTYDHAGRAVGSYHRVGDNPADEVLVSELSYNDLGQVIERRLHAEDFGADSDGDGAAEGASFLQHVDYRYNARGWLTHLNHRWLCDDCAEYPWDAGEPQDLFGMELAYAQGYGALDALPRYDGSIAAAVWKSAEDHGLPVGHERGYGYTYDGLGRVVRARYSEYVGADGWDGPERDRFTVDGPAATGGLIGYDLHGNLTDVRRRGEARANDVAQWGVIDDLHYGYDAAAGNRLVSVSEAAGANDGAALLPLRAGLLGERERGDGPGAAVHV